MTGKAGNRVEALWLSRELLPTLERVLGRDHPDTLTTRSNIASLTGQTGNRAEALWLSRELLPTLERVLGRDHPDTLTTRSSIAAGIGHTGNQAEAVRAQGNTMHFRGAAYSPQFRPPHP